MTELTVDVDEICTPVRPGHVIMPMRRTFSEHISICRQFRGLPLVTDDRATQHAVVDLGRNVTACQGDAHNRKY